MTKGRRNKPRKYLRRTGRRFTDPPCEMIENPMDGPVEEVEITIIGPGEDE